MGILEFLKKINNNKMENQLDLLDEELEEKENDKKLDSKIHFYFDDRRREFPSFFNYHWAEENDLISEFGVIDYIKEIKFKNNMEGAETSFRICENKLLITISISAFKLGIGSGGGQSQFNTKEFHEYLCHELFHAQSLVHIYETYGIEEIKKLEHLTKDHKEEQFWERIAFLSFEEYCACRKNAEKYKVFESVEDFERIKKIFSYSKVFEKPNFEVNNQLFYNISTLVALKDAGKSMKIPEELVPLFSNIGLCFRTNYSNSPLSFEGYQEIGKELERVYLIKPTYL